MDVIKEKVQDMITYGCTELKEAGQAWLDSAGTEQEATATQRLLSEIEDDLTPIDGLIDFAGSEHAKELFGEKGAADMLSHAKEIKAQGAVYCDCPACTAAMAHKKYLCQMRSAS